MKKLTKKLTKKQIEEIEKDCKKYTRELLEKNFHMKTGEAYINMHGGSDLI